MSLLQANMLVIGQTTTFNIVWNSAPSVQEETINSIFEVEDGYLVFGYGGFSDSTSQALRVVKFDLQGELIWQKEHRRSGSLFGGNVAPVARINDSSYVVALTEYAYNVPTSAFLYWINEEGDTTATRFLRSDSLYGPVQQYTLQTIVVDDGGLIVSGRCPQPPNAACLTRTNSAGDLLWERSYPGIGAIDQATSWNDGGFILGGSRNTTIDKAVVIHTDSTGEPIWTQYHGGYAITNALRPLITGDGHLLFPGSWKVDPTWNDNVWWSSLYKYTSDGALVEGRTMISHTKHVNSLWCHHQ
jgi:hypothetical protein